MGHFYEKNGKGLGKVGKMSNPLFVHSWNLQNESRGSKANENLKK
jgi:hypothetical protein